MNEKRERASSAKQRIAAPVVRTAEARTTAQTTARSAAIAYRSSSPHFDDLLQNTPVLEGRFLVCSALAAVLNDFEDAAQYQFTNRALSRSLKIDEKLFRQWLNGEKPMPAAIFAKLPWPVVIATMKKIAELHGKTIGVVKPRDVTT